MNKTLLTLAAVAGLALSGCNDDRKDLQEQTPAQNIAQATLIHKDATYYSKSRMHQELYLFDTDGNQNTPEIELKVLLPQNRLNCPKAQVGATKSLTDWHNELTKNAFTHRYVINERE